MLRFFKEVMFKSTTKKYFSINQSRDVRTPYMFISTTIKDHIPTLAQGMHRRKNFREAHTLTPLTVYMVAILSYIRYMEQSCMIPNQMRKGGRC